MKKVTLLLPDEVISVGGNSRWSIREELPTNRTNVIRALTCNDYHLNYYFPEDRVDVVSIEDVDKAVEVVELESLAAKQSHLALQ